LSNRLNRVSVEKACSTPMGFSLPVSPTVLPSAAKNLFVEQWNRRARQPVEHDEPHRIGADIDHRDALTGRRRRLDLDGSRSFDRPACAVTSST